MNWGVVFFIYVKILYPSATVGQTGIFTYMNGDKIYGCHVGKYSSPHGASEYVFGCFFNYYL